MAKTGGAVVQVAHATERQRDDHSRQQGALDMLASFKRLAYKCPWWAKNQHVNTICGSIFCHPPQVEYERQEWRAPDGYPVQVDLLASKSAFTRGIVVLLHGLEQSSRGPMAMRQAHALAEAAFDVAAVNFRGCGGEEGFTDDLHWILLKLHAEAPARLIYLSGISLGGNVVTKCLSELGENSSKINVRGAAVSCIPLNLVESTGIIDRPGVRRTFYAKEFVRRLSAKAKQLHSKFPAVRKYFKLQDLSRMTTLTEIHDAVVGPLNGFKDQADYYRAPLFILNSRDDPFFDSATLPSAADVGHGTVRIDYEEHGGHCGFVLSENIRFYPMTYLDQPLRFTGTKGRAPNGYLAEQLARALEHLDAAGGGVPTRVSRHEEPVSDGPFSEPSVLGGTGKATDPLVAGTDRAVTGNI